MSDFPLIPFEIPVSQEACRLFHGRGHAVTGLEHLNIDWYSPLVLITLYAPEKQARLQNLAQSLFSALAEKGCSCVVAQYRHEPMAPMEALIGELPETLTVEEHGLKYGLNFGRFQNIGLFPDMANGRKWVKEHASGKRVLNLFSYTCGFSVAAIAGGANKVVNFDMSKRALSIGRDNHRLNNHDLSGVVFEGLDIFRSFGRVKKHGPYDLVISDPPTFQKGSVDIRKDYPRLARRLREYLAPQAELLLCLNAPELGADFLMEVVEQECPDWKFIERIANPAVFVEATDISGLKVLRYQAP